MYEFKTNIISKQDFLKLNEDDIIFITNPGRMGDEDGTTFIIKKDNELIVYRVNGWMYSTKEERESKDYISLEDASKQFPKWMETWNNWNDENYKEKYIYLYMGFGNGLSVDYSMYKDFKSYLDEEIDKYLEQYNDEEKEDYKFSAIFNVWDKALIKMSKDKNLIIK